MIKPITASTPRHFSKKNVKARGPDPETFWWDNQKLTKVELAEIRKSTVSKIAHRLVVSKGVVTWDLLSPDPMPKVKRLNPTETAKLALKALVPQGLTCNEKIM